MYWLTSNLVRAITFPSSPTLTNLVQIPSAVVTPDGGDNMGPMWLLHFLFLNVPSPRLQPKPVNWFSRTMALKTRSDTMNCHLRECFSKFPVFGVISLPPLKPPHFWRTAVGKSEPKYKKSNNLETVGNRNKSLQRDARSSFQNLTIRITHSASDGYQHDVISDLQGSLFSSETVLDWVKVQ